MNAVTTLARELFDALEQLSIRWRLGSTLQEIKLDKDAFGLRSIEDRVPVPVDETKTVKAIIVGARKQSMEEVVAIVDLS